MARRREFIKAGLTTTAALALGGCAMDTISGMRKTPASRPNIVFILADDLGWCDLGADGSTFHESPNLDRIAAEGMRFTQAYAACQVCSPSRASIMTGKYTPRHGITDYLGARTGEAWRELGRETPLLPPRHEPRLRASEVTFPEALRRSGYRTFFAGKWHLGDDTNPGNFGGPEEFGFEQTCGDWRPGVKGFRYFSPWKNLNLDPGPAGESLPIRLGRETARFIESHRDEPFLAYLSFYSVHSPIQTSKERWEKYREKAVAQGPPDHRFVFDRRLPVRQVQDCPIYGGMIEAMDEGVGVVLDALDQLGLTENTIVCFTSDNGGVSSGDAYSSSMLPLRGGKGRQWEGGIREPLYVRYPVLVRAGSTCDVPVSGIDFYPTLLQLAGAPIPHEQDIDGRTFAGLLDEEEDPELTDRDLFWHYPHYGNQGGEPSSVIRRGDWKLIHYYEDGRDELYNLATDPAEQNDVIAANRQTAEHLRKRLDAWLEETDARLPEPDPFYDPEKERARLEEIEREFMPRLETQHSQYLDTEWQPNSDWWGSQVTRD